jgi:error-prone DNA polymerase
VGWGRYECPSRLRQRPGTAKGFVFLLLEDESGMANVVIKPQLYQRYRSLVGAELFVLVGGEPQRRDGTTNVIAKSFKTWQSAPQLATPSAHNSH